LNRLAVEKNSTVAAGESILKIFITGANGYIGGSVASALIVDATISHIAKAAGRCI
jgi:hypothetical protein